MPAFDLAQQGRPVLACRTMVGAACCVGRKVSLQPGALHFLQRALRQHIPTRVVSVNWSAALVCAALRPHQGGIPVGDPSRWATYARAVITACSSWLAS